MQAKGGPGGFTYWLSYKTGKVGGRLNGERKKENKLRKGSKAPGFYLHCPVWVVTIMTPEVAQRSHRCHMNLLKIRIPNFHAHVK